LATPFRNPVPLIARDMVKHAITVSPGNLQFSDMFAATSPPGPSLLEIKTACDMIAAANIGAIFTGPPSQPTGMTVAPGLTIAAANDAFKVILLLGRVPPGS